MQLPYYQLAFEYFFLLSENNTDNTFNTYNTNNTHKTYYTHNTHTHYAQRILNTTI